MVAVYAAAIRHLSLRALLLSLLEALGALWLVVEVTAFFSPAFSMGARAYWWLFLIVGTLAGLSRAWPRLSLSELVPGTDCSITIRVCDLFSVKDVALIVGTNTTFDTALEDGTIDRRSVQGQFTDRLYSSLAQLDRDIAHSLEGVQSTTASQSDKPYGKLERYDVGTVAAVEVQQRRVYLVAIARMNAHRVAQATRRDVQDALPRLWEYVRTRGNLDSLCCPILGSGYSRLDATREELVQEIVRSFIPAVRAGSFCRGLVVAVNPRDFREGHLNLEHLGEFLRHECRYGSAALASGLPATGTPQG